MAGRPRKSNAAIAVAEAPAVVQPEILQPAAAANLAVSPRPTLVPSLRAADEAAVRPVVTAEQAKVLWDEYTATCRTILEENDYIYFACGKKSDGWDAKPMPFRTRALAEAHIAKMQKTGYTDCYIRESKKRSAWDKLARFYGIDTPIETAALCTTADVSVVGEFIVEKLIGDSFKIVVYQDAATLTVRKVSVLLKCVAPNGRTIVGDGACATSERKSGSDSFAHADHDVFSTAFTRAFNRGVSRCIGTGEVSAEEFEAASTPEPTTIASAPSIAVPTGTVSQVAPSQSSAQEVHHSEQNAAAPQPAAEEKPAGVPKAERPPESHITGESKQVVPPAPTPASKGVADAPTSGFAPLENSATLPDRIYHLKAFLFGNAKSEDRMVEYMFFALHPQVSPAKIEKNGHWNPDLWNVAMRSLADRVARMGSMETEAAKLGKEAFIQMCRTFVDGAKQKGVYVSA